MEQGGRLPVLTHVQELPGERRGERHRGSTLVGQSCTAGAGAEDGRGRGQERVPAAEGRCEFQEGCGMTGSASREEHFGNRVIGR